MRSMSQAGSGSRQGIKRPDKLGRMGGHALYVFSCSYNATTINNVTLPQDGAKTLEACRRTSEQHLCGGPKYKQVEGL